MLQKILVVGGNGFLGSAVCKAAVSRGMQVTSISFSGKAHTSPGGHSPAWTSEVNWQAADALQPESYAHLLPGTTAVVHTLGTLFEDMRYKTALARGDIRGLRRHFTASLADMVPGSRNPLKAMDMKGVYERINRDAALRVCETFMSSHAPDTELSGPRPFVYVSAEDVFGPFISARYIQSKREAEKHLEEMMVANPDYRGVYIRPSLIYHPHIRPLTTPVAALLDLSAKLHANAPLGFPMPARMLRSIANVFPAARAPGSGEEKLPTPLNAVANALTIPPIHVDHVAEAICIAVDNAREDVRGVVDVQGMRGLIGWSEKGVPPAAPSYQHS